MKVSTIAEVVGAKEIEISSAMPRHWLLDRAGCPVHELNHGVDTTQSLRDEAVERPDGCGDQCEGVTR